MEIMKSLKRKSEVEFGLSEQLVQEQQELIATPKKRIRWNLYHHSSATATPTSVPAPKGLRADLNCGYPDAAPAASNSNPHQTSSPRRPLVIVQQQLCDLLQGVDKADLIKIISQLTANDPGLEDRITQLLPRPTLEITLGILQGLEKKLMEAIPYSRLGPDRSDYSFNRIKSQMDELRGSLVQYLDFFTLPVSYPTAMQHEYPGESFAYLHSTTLLVHRLPIWSNMERTRELKDPLYERLARHWRITVSEVIRRVNQEGKVFGRQTVGEWAHNLSFHCNQVDGRYGFKEVLDEFTRSLGWIIGIGEMGNQALSSQFVPFGIQAGL